MSLHEQPVARCSTNPLSMRDLPRCIVCTLRDMNGHDDYEITVVEGMAVVVHDHQKDVDGDLTAEDIRIALRDHCPKTRRAFDSAGGVAVQEHARGFMVRTPIRLEEAALFAIELETTFGSLHLSCRVRVEQMNENAITFSITGENGHPMTVERIKRLLRVGDINVIGNIPVSEFVFNEQGEDQVLLRIETCEFTPRS